jgi:glutathione S-transferase
MSPLQLIIGNKAYSSWSLRPWLLMQPAGIAFTEVRLPLYMTGWHEAYGPRLQKRALIARAISAEMHSGFVGLRTEMPMNMRRRIPRKMRASAVTDEIGRVVSIWNDVRSRFGGGGHNLFGDFSISNAMYAPIVSRFATYAVELAGTAARYWETILKLSALRAWYAEAQLETEVIAGYEL